MPMREKLILWVPSNSAKLRDMKYVPLGPAARTKVWSCFFMSGREGWGVEKDVLQREEKRDKDLQNVA